MERLVQDGVGPLSSPTDADGVEKSQRMSIH
jgi:hypothetical protein